jgi:hypothetical protein
MLKQVRFGSVALPQCKDQIFFFWAGDKTFALKLDNRNVLVGCLFGNACDANTCTLLGSGILASSLRFLEMFAVSVHMNICSRRDVK